MEHSRFTNDEAFIQFLNQNGIPAIPSIKADSNMLHWWKFEGGARITDVAIFEGYFFLAVIEQGFSLHVYNVKNDWYNYVRIWKSDVSEEDFLQDLKNILFLDDVCSFDSRVWYFVRETYFEFEWQEMIDDIQNTEQISPEIKSQIFKFNESLVENPKIKVVKQSILDLLALFTRDNLRNSANGLVMQRYFPPSKYERWNLPAEFKLLLHELGETFDRSELPPVIELRSLMEKAKDLHA